MRDLVGVLEGNNTAIVADDEYSASTFVCNFANTDLLKNVVLVIYSEIKCRKVEKIINKKIECEELKSVAESVPVIKIGKTSKLGFGKLVAYVEENGDLVDISKELGSILRKLENKFAIFLGFDLISYLYSPPEVIQAMEELLAQLPNATKLFVLTRLSKECVPIVTALFDIVIRIKKSKGYDIMAYSRVYDVYVEHSIIKELPPIPLYRIDGGRVISIV